jgi:hypothetical protein
MTKSTRDHKHDRQVAGVHTDERTPRHELACSDVAYWHFAAVRDVCFNVGH